MYRYSQTICYCTTNLDNSLKRFIHYKNIWKNSVRYAVCIGFLIKRYNSRIIRGQHYVQLCFSIGFLQLKLHQF